MLRAAGPSWRTRPPSSQIARSHIWAIAPRSWLTKKTVRPSRANSDILPRHLRWNSASPTASTSSTATMSGSTWAATAKARRRYMPEEYRFTGVSMNCSTPANSTMSSKRSRICARFIPRMAPFRKTLSRPVSSGWKPVPTSSSEPTWPVIRTSPRVGAVMRERIFSSVVLPAPLRPITPTAWPRATSKPTSSSAQISSRRTRCRRSRRKARRASPSSSSRSVRKATCSPIAYCFARPRTEITRSDDIGEAPLGAGEVDGADDDEDDRRADRDEQRAQVRAADAEQAPAEAVDHAGHRVQAVDRPVGAVDEARRVGDGARVQPELHHERHDVADVAVLDVERRESEPDAERGQECEQHEER